MKKKLHIHSDNFEWAGCENMPGIFLQPGLIRSEFDITFSYRQTKEYNRGMFKWLGNNILGMRIIPLNFWTTYLYRLRKYFKPIMALKYLAMLNEGYKLFRLFKKIRPDILHVNNGGYFGATSCNSAVIAGHMAGIKKITYMVNSTITKHWWEWSITYFVKKYVTDFIVASNYLKNKSKDFLFKNKIVHVIPNTIIYKKPIDRNLVRKQFDCDDNDILFLCCGVLEKRKGFENIIRVFNNLSKEYGNAKLVIYGEGSEQNNLEDLVKSDRIYFYNKSTKYDIDIDSYSTINACDVLLVPSIADEDFPNVLLIAMMYGKYSVGTNLTGIPEIISNALIGGMVKLEHIQDGFKLFIELLSFREQKFIINSSVIQKEFEKKYGNKVILNQYIKMWNDF